MYEQLNPVVLYHVSKKCDENWSLPRARLNFYDLTFIMEGHVHYYIDDQLFELNKGDVIFIPKGYIRMADSADMECIAFNFDCLGDCELKLENKIAWQEDSAIYPLLKRFNREWLMKNENYMLQCKAIFLIILYELLNMNKQKPNAYVLQMREYIINHLFEEINVKDVADAVGLNNVYCGALFKKHHHCTINEYINQLRINKAVDLLEHRDLSISEIALQTGFSDIYYFSRVFKQIKGVSPSQYTHTTI